MEVVSGSLWPYRLHSPWSSPGQNTGMCSLSFLQGIFPTQGSNPSPLHCRRILYQLSHKGSPRILEWVAYPFSRGSSWPRNRTRVSCIAGGFFTNWTIRGLLRVYLKREHEVVGTYTWWIIRKGNISLKITRNFAWILFWTNCVNFLITFPSIYLDQLFHVLALHMRLYSIDSEYNPWRKLTQLLEEMSSQ